VPDSRPGAPAIDSEAQSRVAALEQSCRRLQLENARLRDELSLAEKYGVSPIAAAAQSPGSIPTLVQAAVISRGAQSSAAEQFLSGGRSKGLAESDVVVDESSLRLDRGSEGGLEPELDVLIGRCIVGRIAAVGRWASALEPVTDPRYRGLAQVIRPTDQGGSFGAEGILVGQGNDLLKLTEIPTTQSVRVGDEVYTSDRDRRFPIPLYYGRVVRVEEAGRNWDIHVCPAVRVSDLKTVAVLKFPQRAGKTLAE
jgi:cell shape-determining protein MreC